MYSEKVMDHFQHPRNVGEIENASGVGTVGNAKCGDIMRMYLDIDDNGIIQDCKFKTFGCGAAVATSSMATELVKGKTIQEALEVTNKAVMEALDGLPPVKVHCSLLAEEAIHAALWDYAEKHKNSGFAPYFVDHTVGIWPQAASGMPFSSASMQSTGDPITDLSEDMAAEQKARTTYDNILRLVDDPDVIAPIRFLREREIVHYQRFGEAKRTRWRVTKRAAEQNSRKSSKMVACGCLTLKSMVMGAHPLTARFLRFPQCGHPSSERSCHSVRQSKGRA